MLIQKALLIAALGASLGMGVQAAEPAKKVNQGPAAAATERSLAVEGLRTAAALARYGQATQNPLALITAASIVRNNPTTDSAAQRIGQGGKESKTSPDLLSVDQLLERARALAADRPDLLALADEVAKTNARGATGGPGRKTTVVASRGLDSYRVTFRGGEPAVVVASGDGDSDLDLYIYDENGNLICKDDDNSDDVVCSWTPRWTGTFTLRVKNRGIANQYTIVHN